MIVGGPEARCAEGLVVVVSGHSIDSFGAAASRAKARGVPRQSEREKCKRNFVTRRFHS